MVNVPDYRLDEEIGVGGTSVVYRATRLSDGATVAVKVVKARPDAPEHPRRLRAEVELVSRVVHDGVVGVHEIGGDDECTWLIMDFVPGLDLQRFIDEQGPPPAERGAELMATVADAVSAIHEAGLVHRDLKPANILFDGDRPRVADFGVARRTATVESGSALTGGTDWLYSETAVPGLAGTIAYMAPEQWRGEDGDARSDVYALGGTLYTTLTGHRPFPQRSMPELAYAVAVTPPPAPSEHGVPAAFDRVVATAMAKHPDERYPDAAGFAAAVRAAAQGRALPTAAARRSSRRNWLLIGTVAALALLLGGWALVWHPWQKPSTEERVVCARDLTVRDKPRSKTVIAVFYRDDRIRVHNDTPIPGWARTDLPGGREGWVLMQFLGPPCVR